MKGFRAFILRGNVVDLAVGIVIGAAFTAVVNGFVKAFLTPIVGLAAGATGDFSNDGFTIRKTLFPWGTFVQAMISFVLVAAALYFLVVLPVNAFLDRYKTEPEVVQETRQCPYCLSSIPVAATKCSFCTADVAPANAR